MAEAGWYADPLGRFEHRYWDGSQWTEHVARAGQAERDPLDQAGDDQVGDQTSASAYAETTEQRWSDDAPAEVSSASAADADPFGPAGDSTRQLPSQPSDAPHSPPHSTLSTASTPGSTTERPQTNGLATASLVVGIASLLGLLIIVGGLAGIAAIVMGAMARRRIRDSDGRETGDGMAIAGIVCGAIALLLSILLIILLVAGALLFFPFLEDVNTTVGFALR